MYVAVAEIDGVAVGRSCLMYNYMGDPPNAYSFASTVTPVWRSRGIGSALIAHNERVARSRGMYHISGHTGKNNPRAASWRERMGYRRVCEETIHWTEADGRRVESLSWRFERMFTPPASYRIRRWMRSRVRSGVGGLPYWRGRSLTKLHTDRASTASGGLYGASCEALRIRPRLLLAPIKGPRVHVPLSLSPL